MIHCRRGCCYCCWAGLEREHDFRFSRLQGRAWGRERSVDKRRGGCDRKGERGEDMGEYLGIVRGKFCCVCGCCGCSCGHDA